MTLIKDPIKKNIKKFPYIDALRGIAVLAVLMDHCWQTGAHEASSWVKIVGGQGARGVQLFYVMSALTLYLSMNSRSRIEKNPNLNFFIRRFFRIAPLFYLGIIYYLWQDGTGPRYFLGDAPGISARNIISTFTFTNGFNPYWINSIVPGGWSIAVEMTFYCTLPIIFMFIKNIRAAFIFSLLAIVSSLLFVYFLSHRVLISSSQLWEDYLFFFFPSQLFVFICGIILFYLIKKPEGSQVKMWQIISATATTFLLIFVLNAILPMRFPTQFIYGIGFMFFGWFLSVKHLKIFVNPIITYIGKVSFSMYLVHFAVLHYMEKFNFVDFVNNESLNLAIRYFFLALFSVILSTVTYTLIEVPGQDLGRKIINYFEGRKEV
jgi:peptidoglycan/LPS O-acetylase OafA/YrhL